MCQVWLKCNNFSLSYEGLNKLQIQTITNLQKQVPATPFPLSMLENSKMQTSVTSKVFSQHITMVSIAQGWGGTKCADSKIFQHLWPRL